MITLLIDTPLLKDFTSTGRARLVKWLEETGASLFLSADSVTALIEAVEKRSTTPSPRLEAQRKWIDDLLARFGDRVHPIDAKVAKRAGELSSNLNVGPLSRRYHDAHLVAIAQIYGHGLLTKRTTIFRAWTNIAIVQPYENHQTQ